MGEALAILFIVPTLLEAYDDRKGEDKKGKVKDLILAGVMWVSMVIVFRLVFDTPVIGSISMLLGFRVLVFDYLVQYILIKNGVIYGHWFFYKGKTAKWDRVLPHLNPWIVLALRVVFFVGMVFVYISTWPH